MIDIYRKLYSHVQYYLSKKVFASSEFIDKGRISFGGRMTFSGEFIMINSSSKYCLLIRMLLKIKFSDLLFSGLRFKTMFFSLRISNANDR